MKTIFFPHMTAGDPPQQKTSQGNEKKKEDENITQGDPPQEERSLRIKIEEELKNITEGDPPKQKRSQGNEKNTEDDNITQEELKMTLDFKRGEDYIEVLCGATNKNYGDYVGRLKINNEGQYFITCECCPECPLVNVTLEEFEKHALREGSGRWKRIIWVHCEDEDKVPLWKTPLIKYYTHQENVANRKDSAMRKQNFHRDEFLRCTRCGKERRADQTLRTTMMLQTTNARLVLFGLIKSDPPKQKRSQGNEKKTEDDNITQEITRREISKAKDLPGFMESLVKQMSVNLKRIHSLGIKKVAVGLLQPIGCLPVLNVISFRTNCIGLLNVISKDHNKMLLKAVQELNKEAADKSVFITLDLYNSFLSAIETRQKKRAEKSTLMNPLQPCCEGNNLEDSCGSVDDEGSKKYSLCENSKLSFFWDTLHPSQNGWFAVYTQ
ncbi:GDSL esterase/lipase [Glycine soja]